MIREVALSVRVNFKAIRLAAIVVRCVLFEDGRGMKVRKNLVFVCGEPLRQPHSGSITRGELPNLLPDGKTVVENALTGRLFAVLHVLKKLGVQHCHISVVWLSRHPI